MITQQSLSYAIFVRICFVLGISVSQSTIRLCNVLQAKFFIDVVFIVMI